MVKKVDSLDDAGDGAGSSPTGSKAGGTTTVYMPAGGHTTSYTPTTVQGMGYTTTPPGSTPQKPAAAVEAKPEIQTVPITAELLEGAQEVLILVASTGAVDPTGTVPTWVSVPAYHAKTFGDNPAILAVRYGA